MVEKKERLDGEKKLLVDWMKVRKEDILEASERLNPRYREEFREREPEVLERIQSLELGVYSSFQVEKDGKERLLITPTLESRVLQRILMDRMDFGQRPCSYAFREGKGHHRAMKKVDQELEDYDHGLKLDVKDFFPSLDHGVLLGKVPPRFREEVGALLKFEYRENGELKENRRGVPLGNPLSGKLANLYLGKLDKKLLFKTDYHNCFYLRYADDLIFLADVREVLEDLKNWVRDRLARINLELNESKTEFIDLERRSFDWLGYNLRKGGDPLVRRKTRKKILRGIYQSWARSNEPELLDTLSGYRGTTIHTSSNLNLLTSCG